MNDPSEAKPCVIVPVYLVVLPPAAAAFKVLAAKVMRMP